MAKKCEQCGGVYAKAYERCPECTPQPSVPSGEAVAIVASEIGDAIAAHDAGENVNAVDRAKHVVAALLPEMNDYWHNGYAEGKRDASLLAAPPQERVSEVTEAMVKAGVQAFDAGVPWLDVQGQVRAILTAALAPSRTEGK